MSVQMLETPVVILGWDMQVQAEASGSLFSHNFTGFLGSAALRLQRKIRVGNTAACPSIPPQKNSWSFWCFFWIVMNLYGSVLLTPTKVYHAELATWDVGLSRHVLAVPAPAAPVAFTSFAFSLLCLYFSTRVFLWVSLFPNWRQPVTITTAVCWWRR